MLCMFSFGCFQIYQNKSAKNIAKHFIETIVPIKCMPEISAVGSFVSINLKTTKREREQHFSERQS